MTSIFARSGSPSDTSMTDTLQAEDRGEGTSTTPLVPAIAAFSAVGALAMGFGAGYCARAFKNSTAYFELLEKFPGAHSPFHYSRVTRPASIVSV